MSSATATASAKAHAVDDTFSTMGRYLSIGNSGAVHLITVESG